MASDLEAEVKVSNLFIFLNFKGAFDLKKMNGLFRGAEQLKCRRILCQICLSICLRAMGNL